MNKSQKLVLAVFIPIVVLVLTFGIANSVLDGESLCISTLFESRSSVAPSSGICPKYYHIDNSVDVRAFDFDKTWWIWLLALGLIGICEFNLFKDNKAIRRTAKNNSASKKK